MNQDYTRSDRRIYLASSTVVIILALAAGILSYSALKTLAIMSGINPILALLFPLVIDGLILSGTLLVLFFAVRGRRTFFGIFLTLLGVTASIAGNVAVSDNNLTHQIVHGAPALVLFLSLEALTILLRTRFKENADSFLTRRTSDNPYTNETKSAEEKNVEETEASFLNRSPHEEGYVSTHVDKFSECHQTSQNAPEQPVEYMTDDSSRESNKTLTEAPVKSYNVPELPRSARNSENKATSYQKAEVSPHGSSVDVKERKSQTKSSTKNLVKPNTVDEDNFQYVVIKGNKREQIENLVKQNPDIRPKTVTEVLGGDRSYNSKLLREIRG